MAKDKLTPKQARFVAAYSGNATEAARLAGYKGNDVTLQAVASENLRKPLIAAAIAARETRVIAKLVATREERQRFWSDVMTGAARDGAEEAPKFSDRLKASELLGRSESDFVEKHEHSGTISIVVVDPYAVKPGG